MISNRQGLTAALAIISAAAVAQTMSLSSSAAAAGPATTFVHLTSKAIIDLVGTPSANGAPVAAVIDRHENYSTLFASRSADGTVEQHDHFHDFMTILSGEVTLTYGGTQKGHTVVNGESRDGTIVGGTTITLRAGDYVQIPAGVPHLMTNPKNNLRYLVVKVRE